ncbi:MAG TPA: hypothetical protein VIH99_13450 [Bdellovibrionota bacterium]
MKIIKWISVGALFIGFQAMAADCPDFNGRYFYSDENVYIGIDIAQTACEKMTEVHDIDGSFTATYEHAFDGVKHLVEDTGDFQAYETAKMEQDRMTILEERHGTSEVTGEPWTHFLTIEMMFSEDGMLVIKRENRDEDGRLIDSRKSEYKRK